MPVGSSPLLFKLEPNGTYELMDQGFYGYEYGLWSWDTSLGQLTMEARTAEPSYPLLGPDEEYTDNFNFAAYENLDLADQQAETEELWTRVFTLSAAEQPSDHWRMNLVEDSKVLAITSRTSRA